MRAELKWALMMGDKEAIERIRAENALRALRDVAEHMEKNDQADLVHLVLGDLRDALKLRITQGPSSPTSKWDLTKRFLVFYYSDENQDVPCLESYDGIEQVINFLAFCVQSDCSFVTCIDTDEPRILTEKACLTVKLSGRLGDYMVVGP